LLRHRRHRQGPVRQNEEGCAGTFEELLKIVKIK
jgi:hypothetical protein